MKSVVKNLSLFPLFLCTDKIDAPVGQEFDLLSLRVLFFAFGTMLPIFCTRMLKKGDPK